MKKVIGLFLLFATLNITLTQASINKTSYALETGVGNCFGVWRFVYHGALANGATIEVALDLAGAAFNSCVANNQ